MASRRIPILLMALAIAPGLRATVPNAADRSIRQFLAKDDSQHPYRALRRLEAENGNRRAWVEAITEYSRQAGFRYRITSEGGSTYIRTNILRAVLDGERDAISRGETARASLARENYTFEANGLDTDGLAQVILSPRRKDRVLLAGTMFLKPTDGELVRLKGRLARNPSFWVKNVDIIRSYERIGGTIVPVALESRAELRLLGSASLRMTYSYSQVDGHPVAQSALAND